MPKGFSYSKEKVDNFLDAIVEVLPISLTAWERVAEVHLLWYPDLNQTVKELHNKRISMEKRLWNRGSGGVSVTRPPQPFHWVRHGKTVIQQEAEVPADGRWWCYKRWHDN
jgi:hypothetical protein